MKILLFFAAILSFITAKAQSGKPAADAVLHIWVTEQNDGRMQILKNDEGYYGKMLWGKDLMEADGKTYKKDVNNPDPALKSRILKDYILVSGLVYKDGKWVNGKIYDYENGNSYDVSLEIKNGVLYMRAFKGVPIFGKTVKWDLVQ
jgi:uncharacterized protein (DUF2147 family)